MAQISLKCPHCECPNAVKHGVSAAGKQRHICRNKGCWKTF